jgi:hypothetical protein
MDDRNAIHGPEIWPFDDTLSAEIGVRPELTKSRSDPDYSLICSYFA